MMNRWHATKPSPCRAHLLGVSELASCAISGATTSPTVRCLVWKYIDKELAHVSFWCPNLGFWMNSPSSHDFFFTQFPSGNGIVPNDTPKTIQPNDSAFAAIALVELPIGPDMCYICEQSPSSVGRRDPWYANLAKRWELSQTDLNRLAFSQFNRFPKDFSLSSCVWQNLILRDAHPPEAEELAGIDKVLAIHCLSRISSSPFLESSEGAGTTCRTCSCFSTLHSLFLDLWRGKLQLPSWKVSTNFYLDGCVLLWSQAICQHQVAPSFEHSML